MPFVSRQTNDHFMFRSNNFITRVILIIDYPFPFLISAICQPPCQNGGRCLRPGSCVCPTGYAGTYCQYQAYVRTGSGSASSVHTSSSGSVRPGTGGYSRITSSTSTRPLTGTSTATFSIRPGSSTSSRTYISRVRPGTATTGSRTYAVTYTTGGRGKMFSHK